MWCAVVLWCGETLVWCCVVWCDGGGGGGGAVAVSGGSVSHVTEARLCPAVGSHRHSESSTSPSQSQHERNCPHPGRPVWQPDRSQGRDFVRTTNTSQPGCTGLLEVLEVVTVIPPPPPPSCIVAAAPLDTIREILSLSQSSLLPLK